MNSVNTSQDLTNVVAEHYNQLGEKGLKERANSRIFYQRNFNNWIKSMAIGDALMRIKQNKDSNYQLSVLDLCSGKGGDLLKWKNGQISQLICVDIAEISVEQSEIRYKDLVERTKRERNSKPLFQAEFITADCTKVQLKTKYKNNDQMFDLTSCQFSLHYSFESLPQAEMMMRNACECLKPGGIFIGTTLNAYTMIKRLRESGGSSFGNDVYRIEFDADLVNSDVLPLFGAKYHFYLEGVVDCPEFLAYFPVVQKLATRYNMNLIYCQSFGDFFKTHVQSKPNVELLKKMMSLEQYPPDHGVQLSGLDKDYKHADEFITNLFTSQKDDDVQPISARVGTLSLPEWEASSLYLVFAFQKAL